MLHTSYSFALAYEADLAARVLDGLSLGSKELVLDPFCGTGTTLLESKLHGLASIGVDANPVCVLVSRAKTDWTLDARVTNVKLKSVLESAAAGYATFLNRFKSARARGANHPPQSDALFTRSPAGRYLLSSGLIRRGWISPRPALKTLLIAEQLWNVDDAETRFLVLSLLGLLVPDISNMSYGPEIYRSRKRRDPDVFRLFADRVIENLDRIQALQETGTRARTQVRLGDSANGGLRFVKSNSIDAVVTSPPYLSDHDYTRLTRLELVYSAAVTSQDGLRKLKKQLLRSSSKNVYKDDAAANLVKRFTSVRNVVTEVASQAATRDSGFARVYPKLVGEYFGGMYKHFQELGRVLRPGGRGAYVVGDQSSFFATPIPTARILTQLVEGCGADLHVASMKPVRKYHGTRGKVTWSNKEWLILIQKGRTRSTTL